MNATSEISSVPSTATTIRAVRERRILGIGHTDIALASNRSDGGPAHTFELPAQVTDVHVERSFVRCGLALIEYACELVARDDSADGAHQHFENRELRRGQLDRRTAERHGPIECVDS